MTKLYSRNDAFTPTISTETFREYHKTASVVSSESVDIYLSTLKDKFMAVGRFFDAKTERFFKEVDLNRFETTAKAKKVKYANFRHEVVSKPEQFKGNYLDYIEQLNHTALSVSQLVDVLLSNLKLAVSTFINEYTDSKTDLLYGSKNFKDGEKLIEVEKKEIAKYFTAPAAKVRATAGDLIASNKDFEPIYKEFDKLKLVFTADRNKEIENSVRSVSELVDVLIDLNMKSNVLNRNDHLKKQLLEAIHVSAGAVEYYYATYSNTLFLSKAFTELTQALNNFPID